VAGLFVIVVGFVGLTDLIAEVCLGADRLAAFWRLIAGGIIFLIAVTNLPPVRRWLDEK
jgi:hypothetical protein